MTPLEFASAQKRLKLTDGELAKALGVCVSTIRKRRDGKVRIAGEVKLAMKWLQFDSGCSGAADQ